MALRKMISNSNHLFKLRKQFQSSLSPLNKPQILDKADKSLQNDYILNYLIKMGQMNENKSLKISIEGNIASGKSSIINYLKSKIQLSSELKHISISNNDDDNLSCKMQDLNTPINFKIMQEPVHLWRNLNGNNLLDLMYKDPHKWAFSFHSYVQLTMLQNHLNLSNDPRNESCVNVMERSLYSARYCFVENIFKSNVLKEVEYEILDKWFNWMIENHDCGLDVVFYLRTSPETCMRRLMERNRPEETNRISLEYLQNLHDLHENWLNTRSETMIGLRKFYKPSSVIVIDANQSVDDVYKTIEHETKNAVLMKN